MTDDPTRLTEVLRGIGQARRFGDGPVGDEALRDILEVARWTGSSGNRQPWRFLVVRNPATLGALADLAPEAPHIRDAPLAVVVVMPGDRGVLHAFDEGRVTERILAAATAHGLAVAIGWIPADARDDARRALGVPDDRLVRTVVSIGPPQPGDEGKRSRIPLSQLVHDEQWRGSAGD